jgi:hypothetical protein
MELEHFQFQQPEETAVVNSGRARSSPQKTFIHVVKSKR